jgi:hypothetical protein
MKAGEKPTKADEAYNSKLKTKDSVTPHSL